MHATHGSYENSAGGYHIGEHEGDDPPPRASMLARYDGATLTQLGLEMDPDFNALWSDGTRVVAVGDEGIIALIEGGVVTPMASGVTLPMLVVDGPGFENLHAAGPQATIVRFDGAGWHILENDLPETTAAFAMERSTDGVWVAMFESAELH